MDHPTSLASLAFIRDGDKFYTNEAVYLACMLHAKGQSRTPEAETEVAKLLDDHNLKP
jgi:hypothetical protein